MGKLGWIGLGEMGAPMAARLVAAGHDVTVWNRAEPPRARAAAHGAHVGTSPGDVAGRAEATFVCVTDGRAVEAVLFGENGVAAHAPHGSLIVDHSTIHPEQSRSFAVRLRERGVGYVDAPVSGGPAGAVAGTLASFLGGDAADVDRARAWIGAYTRTATHLGPAGSGQLAKSCNQAVVASTVAIWAEVVAYARASGLDPALVVEAVAGGWADSPIRAAFGPALASGGGRAGRQSLILKDLEIVGDVAASARAAMPLTSLVTALFRMAFGHAREPAGMTALLRLYPDPATGSEA